MHRRFRKLRFGHFIIGAAFFLLLALSGNARAATDGWTTADVNMRTCPSTGCPPILVIPAGTLITVEYCDSWCLVRYWGRLGYVYGRYVIFAPYYPPVYPRLYQVPPPFIYVPPRVYRPPVYRAPHVKRPPKRRPPKIYRPHPPSAPPAVPLRPPPRIKAKPEKPRDFDRIRRPRPSRLPETRRVKPRREINRPRSLPKISGPRKPVKKKKRRTYHEPSWPPGASQRYR
jgi:uncharacterized protein YraI